MLGVSQETPTLEYGHFSAKCAEATLKRTNFGRDNQLRLYFASFAYVLMHGLRRLGLTGTACARAQCTTIRVKWLKIGARVRISVRKIWLSFSESYPHAQTFAQILTNLQKHPPWLAPG